MNLPLRLKRKVKSRHKPISDPKTELEISQISRHLERCPQDTAYFAIVLLLAVTRLSNAACRHSTDPLNLMLQVIDGAPPIREPLPD